MRYHKHLKNIDAQYWEGCDETGTFTAPGYKAQLFWKAP